jgi:hypothetical protein
MSKEVDKTPAVVLPVGLRRKIFAALSSAIARDVKQRGATETEILADFEVCRKTRRKTRRGHTPVE